MVEKDEVSKDFRKQVLGYGLTTAEIVYRRPDRHWLLQTYVWQDYDLFPNFPALKDFLAFWETTLDDPAPGQQQLVQQPYENAGCGRKSSKKCVQCMRKRFQLRTRYPLNSFSTCRRGRRRSANAPHQ